MGTKTIELNFNQGYLNLDPSLPSSEVWNSSVVEAR